jgi:predicted alpha/beta hydrolase family esterase
MACSSILDFRILVVPGLHGSGPAHWQSRWQQLYPYFERVEQACWDVPDLAAWSAQLDRVLRASSQPTLIVAHSFGCLTAVRSLQFNTHSVSGALLVAPADPDKFGVAGDLAQARLSVPAIVVGSMNDPWMEISNAARWANSWGGEFVNAGALGHINADSRLGDWRLGVLLLQRLAGSIPAAGYAKAVCRRPEPNLLKVSV